MSKKIFTIVVLLLIGAISYILFFGPQSLLRQHLIEERNNALESQIQTMKKENEALLMEIERLKTDTTYLEFLARTRLGMSRKNEKVFRFITKDSSSKKD